MGHPNCLLLGRFLIFLSIFNFVEKYIGPRKHSQKMCQSPIAPHPGNFEGGGAIDKK